MSVSSIGSTASLSSLYAEKVQPHEAASATEPKQTRSLKEANQPTPSLATAPGSAGSDASHRGSSRVNRFA